MKDIQFWIYQSAEDEIKVDPVIKDESIWLNQTGMAELFGVDRTTISRRLKNIFAEGELQKKEVCAIFAHTSKHGAMVDKTQQATPIFDNLDAIISVGYRG